MTNDQVIPPKRKHPRLKEYDYSQPGSYFVTICTKDRKHLLGQIPIGRNDLIRSTICLSDIGKAAFDVIQNTSASYSNVTIEKFAIMPNHIHLLITIAPSSTDTDDRNSQNTSLHTIVRSFKTLVSKKVGYSLWQDSYYDHIIRNDADFQKVWDYIDINPEKWQEDKYFK